jgi:hypothetical protein
MVIIFGNGKTPITLQSAIMRTKAVNIVRTWKGDYVLYKRSDMEKSVLETIITAGAGIVTALAGVFGFQRFQAKKTTQLDRDKIAITEIQYIIDTLKSYREDAEKKIQEQTILIIEKDKRIDDLMVRIAELETELRLKN